MMKRKKWIVIGIVILVVAAGGVAGFFATHRVPPVGTEVGDTAPNFTLNDFTGKPVQLSQFRGHVVLLEFWQSTCPDCRRETPYLGKLYTQFKDKGLVWIGVNLNHDHKLAEQFLKDNGLMDEQIMVGESFSAAMKIVKLFNVPLVPCVLIIDRRGIIRYRGVYPEKPMASDIEPWL